jgi:hypothetical protein
MPSYLEIALRVTGTSQSVYSDPRPDPRASSKRVANETFPSPVEVAARPQPHSKALAPCGSPHCAGCYDVGDGGKIHPPKCGKDFLTWFTEWEGKGCQEQ